MARQTIKFLRNFPSLKASLNLSRLAQTEPGELLGAGEGLADDIEPLVHEAHQRAMEAKKEMHVFEGKLHFVASQSDPHVTPSSSPRLGANSTILTVSSAPTEARDFQK